MCTWSLNPLGGGAQKYVYDLAYACSHEYDVHVIFGENEFDTENIFKMKLEASGVKTHVLDSMRKNISLQREYQSYRSLVSLLRELRPDVVHLNSSKMAIIGSRAARAAGVPRIVYTAHGFPFLDTSRSKWKNTLFEYVTRWGFQSIDAVITISQRECNIVKAWREFRGDVSLVYNGRKETERFSRSDTLEELGTLAGTRIKDRIKEGAVVIGSISELRSNKGVDILLAALANLDTKEPWVYLHLGTGKEKEHIQTLVSEYGLQDRVLFCGFVDEAPRYLELFDIFVLPSLQEGTPYVIVEAGQARKAVVATRVGAVEEMVEHNVSGLLEEPGCSHCLREALSELVDNKDLREQYAQTLHQTITERFNFERMLQQTTSVYES